MVVEAVATSTTAPAGTAEETEATAEAEETAEAVARGGEISSWRWSVPYVCGGGSSGVVKRQSQWYAPGSVRTDGWQPATPTRLASR